MKKTILNISALALGLVIMNAACKKSGSPAAPSIVAKWHNTTVVERTYTNGIFNGETTNPNTDMASYTDVKSNGKIYSFNSGAYDTASYILNGTAFTDIMGTDSLHYIVTKLDANDLQLVDISNSMPPAVLDSIFLNFTKVQ
jgi:hypothetical protein